MEKASKALIISECYHDFKYKITQRSKQRKFQSTGDSSTDDTHDDVNVILTDDDDNNNNNEAAHKAKSAGVTILERKRKRSSQDQASSFADTLLTSAVCNYCPKVISGYESTTSNFRRHIESWHKAE